MKKEKLQIGNIYWGAYGNDRYLLKLKAISKSYYQGSYIAKKLISSSIYHKAGNFGIDINYNWELASQEDVLWMESCILAGKLVDKPKIMSYEIF